MPVLEEANRTSIGLDDEAFDRGASVTVWGPDPARATAEFLLHECGWTEVTVDPLTDNERAIRAFRASRVQPLVGRRADRQGQRP